MIYFNESSLERMSMDDANKYLDPMAKKHWLDLHNKTAHVFDYWCGKIRKVPAEGWWY